MDPLKYAVYDGRQLALKVSANSVYGFTGAQVGQLPFLEISSTVTGYGRQMIESTKSQVESMYSKEHGYEHDAQVIYGDTDSVMIKFGTEDLGESMRLGQEAAEKVSASFLKPIKLEFEKCYHPYLLMNKKRYVGLLWTGTEKFDKMDCKGIETVRRDNCLLVRELIDNSIKAILIHKNPELAISYIKTQISELLMNRMDISKLVITKALTRSEDQYVAGNKQAHVELAARIKKRDPGMAPAVGDRVPYVIIKGEVGAKNYEKAEDPVFVLDNSIPIDSQWYLDHQLKEPLNRLFEPVLGDNVGSITSGDHTRKIHKATPKMGGMMNFGVVVTLRCLGCKATLTGKEPDQAVCGSCQERKGEIYLQKMAHLATCEKLFWQLSVQCQRVTADNFKDIIGIARDSPLYYRKKKAEKDLAEARDVIARFVDPYDAL